MSFDANVASNLFLQPDITALMLFDIIDALPLFVDFGSDGRGILTGAAFSEQINTVMEAFEEKLERDIPPEERGTKLLCSTLLDIYIGNATGEGYWMFDSP